MSIDSGDVELRHKNEEHVDIQGSSGQQTQATTIAVSWGVNNVENLLQKKMNFRIKT